jgi:GNAT superfamily N-acetyltransferase
MADARGSIDQYVSGFRDRVRAMRHPGQEVIDEPGLVGLVGRNSAALDGRVLVLDDRAHETLAARLPELFARVFYVFDDAEACRGLMSQDARFRPTRCTAMVCNGLGAIPELSLPAGLTLRPVSASPKDAAEVPLADAASAALRSDAEMAPTTDLESFLEYLRSIPNTRYVAAVDDGGDVRATAAAASWGSTTGVFFVNTDPAWRGRGIGTAMTAAALRYAAAAGAERACLDASSLGLSIYERLGFESVGAITQFVDQG